MRIMRMNILIKSMIRVNTLVTTMKKMNSLLTTMMRVNTLIKVEKLAPLTKCTKISTLYMAHNSVKWEHEFEKMGNVIDRNERENIQINKEQNLMHQGIIVDFKCTQMVKHSWRSSKYNYKKNEI